MSFFASLFGMNAPELSEDGVMPLKDQLVWMCKSLAISS